MAKFDVVVVGLGAMGSAALYQLARRGVSVAGIERFTIGHDHGSSHGETRIFRLGYFEHHSYVPLLRRSYALWRELEAASGKTLLTVTGIAEIGPPDGRVVPGTLLAARMHDLPHEVLSAAEIMRRFPAYSVPSDFVGVVQPDGGFLAAEAATAAMVAQARTAGADVRSEVTVRSITPHRGGLRLKTSGGNVDAGTVIVAAGPWAKALVPTLPAPLRVTRQVMTWFQPVEQKVFQPVEESLFAAARFPVFLLESGDGIYYGFPLDSTGSVKIAKHHHRDQTVDPDDFNRTVNPADEAVVRPVLADHLPAANGKLVGAKTCLYTVAPDGDFIIDRLPDRPDIIIASPCSGHGFKFAPVIGEILADLAVSGATHHDISRFRLARFG